MISVSNTCDFVNFKYKETMKGDLQKPR